MGLFKQIILYIVSAVIVIMYVQPTFKSVGLIQDEIAAREEDLSKVLSVTSQLATLVTTMQKVSDSDLNKLQTYMPNTIDEVAIARDITTMTQLSNVSITGGSVGYDGAGGLAGGNRQGSVDSVPEPARHNFNLSIDSSYDNLKEFLYLVEQNNYPLELVEMKITANNSGNNQGPSSGGVSSNLKLQTFSIGEQLINLN